MKAWLFQDPKQLKKLGEDKCPWSVGYYDPDGKRKQKTLGAKSRAEKFLRKIEGQLAAGTYQAGSAKTWKDFRREYEEKILPRLRPQTQQVVKGSLKRFAKLVKPVKVGAIKTQTIDSFITARAEEKVRPATINKDLRHIKAVLRVAHEWGYLPRVPKFRMLKEPVKLVRYVTPDDFAKLYGACDQAGRPTSEVYSAADWWRALLVFAYMTGWRIGEILALRWDDVSLDRGEAITRADDNKGGRDESVKLHPVVVDHLRKLIDFGPVVFFWPNHERTLYADFEKIQQAAEISPQGGPYGFHDLRRAFATCNAERLTADSLQALMRHKSYLTTKRYINMAKQANKAAENLFVPDCLKPEPE